MKSQKDQVLEYLQSGKTLTPLEALELFNSLRLGALIHKLRMEGYDITTTIIETTTHKQVAQYKLNRKLGQGKMF